MRSKLVLISCLTLILAAFFAVSSCHKDDNDCTIKVSGIEFIPNCFLKDGKMVGIDSDIARMALENAGVDIEMGMADSWNAGYNAALDGTNRAMLTVGYSAERKNLFKWAGPTSQGMYGIFARGNTGHTFPMSIEESKTLGPIAAVRGWLETTTLEDLGFQNLKYFDTYSAALAAFMGGEVNFIASDFFHLAKSVPAGYFMDEVHTVTRYKTVYYYIAFSKNISDAVVEKVQSAIETLIKDKTTVSIMKTYMPLMPGDYLPGTIQLFAEVSPPYNYGIGHDTTRENVGSSVDIVNEIQRRTGYVNKINLSTWTDAYTIPQYLPNSAVFTTARTTERESMFQWVGPICPNKTYFYTLAKSGIVIETLDQAKALKTIGTPKDWYTHDFLIKNNFANIVATAITTQQSFEQLMNGEIEALLMTDVEVNWLAKENGVSMSELTQNMEALSIDGYIAFSLNTPTAVVQQWQSNLDAMKTDGTFDAIWAKWFK